MATLHCDTPEDCFFSLQDSYRQYQELHAQNVNLMKRTFLQEEEREGVLAQLRIEKAKVDELVTHAFCSKKPETFLLMSKRRIENLMYDRIFICILGFVLGNIFKSKICAYIFIVFFTGYTAHKIYRDYRREITNFFVKEKKARLL